SCSTGRSMSSTPAPKSSSHSTRKPGPAVPSLRGCRSVRLPVWSPSRCSECHRSPGRRDRSPGSPPDPTAPCMFRRTPMAACWLCVGNPEGLQRMPDAPDLKVADHRYLQVARTLRKEIVDGVYPVGSQLPTEHELCERFAVSRYTIREALRRLREDNLVSSR